MSPKKSPSFLKKVKGFAQSLGSQTSSAISSDSNVVISHVSPGQVLTQQARSIQSENTEHFSTPSIQPSHETPQPLGQTVTEHGRNPSNFNGYRAVRLPSQEQAAAPAEFHRLRAGQVLLTLAVSYHQERLACIEDIIVEYEENTAFDELTAVAMKRLHEHNGSPAATFYLKAGRCRLIRHDTDKVIARCILETQREWNENLPSMIPKFRGWNPNADFHLGVDWDYSSLQIDKVPDEPYSTTIRRAIEAKIRRNWEKRKYIPRKDLEEILTKDTISKLIQEDESLQTVPVMIINGGKPFEKARFVEDIWKWGSRLLALCVYVNLPLACLYRMRSNGLRDIDLPLAEGQCPHSDYTTIFDLAADVSGAFAAHIFAPDEHGELEHLQLPLRAVVPIFFEKDNSNHFLGGGSFGKVYKVHIDDDHHSFSNLEKEDFALKIFYDLSAHTPINFDKESDTLARLAEAPHPNIMTHLASWKQNGICYMLFRCADCNLRTYLHTRPQPELTKANLLSLLSQMKGLADGVRHIHNLGPSKLNPKAVDRKSTTGNRLRAECCFHHDLKPANILVFIDPDNSDITFSISDFGSAKIKEILSGPKQPSPFTSNLSPGDAVYGAPDAAMEGKTSRPYDLWSLGCIFMELLLWIVGFEDPEYSLHKFADDRMGVPNLEGNQDQAFWYRDDTGRIHRKPAVVEQLKLLRERSKDRGVLPRLHRIVDKLLTTLPSQRLDAPKLCNDLDAIIMQARHDLKEEDFYINNNSTQNEIAAPPTSAGFSGDVSRKASIDDRGIFAPYGDTLFPNPNAQRRSTVGGSSRDVRPMRLSAHGRNQSSPEAKVSPLHLAPIDTFVDSATPPEDLSNSPRISISDFSNENVREEILLQIDEFVPPIGSHNQSFASRLRRTRTPDSEVFDSD